MEMEGTLGIARTIESRCKYGLLELGAWISAMEFNGAILMGIISIL